MYLIELLREEMGDTYGVSAFAGFPSQLQMSSVNVVFSVAADRAAKLEKIALAEVGKLATNGLSKEHFEAYIFKFLLMHRLS